MIFDLFGRSIEINIRKRTSILNKAENKFKEKYLFRITIYLFIVAFFMLFSMKKVGNEEYKIGQVAKNDVIAHINKQYERNFLDEELKVKIKQNTVPEFDRIEDVDKKQLDRLDNVLQNLALLDLNKDENIREFIKKNDLRISVPELKNIAINQNVKYYLHLSNVLDTIYEKGITKKEELNKVLAENQIVLNDIEKKFILNFIEPNLKINKVKTLNKIEKNIERLAQNKVIIKKGDLIIKKGDVITALDYDNLNSLGYVSKHDLVIRNIGKILIYIIVSFFFFKLSEKYFKKSFESKGFYSFLITTIIVNLIYMLLPEFVNLKLIAPMLLLPIIGIVLMKEYIFVLFLISINYIFVITDIRWAFILIILSIIAMHLNESITSRNELVKNSIYLGLMQTIFVFSLFLYYNIEIIDIVPGLIFSLLSGIFTGILSIGLLPYFENTFNILTDIKLVELSNFSNPLLKKLLLVAPGTFHHSLMVGALAEAGAEAIGANSILCRVASYYHDIGKMKRPMYFVENQLGIENPHNLLKPTLSTLIITMHTKDGYLLGKKHDLPDEILDIILEHHGTTLVQYFYYKALAENQKVEEADFRYTGPKPRTKESGVVMLADTIEAAVRATPDKSSDNIEKLIRYLIKSKVEDRQLSECNITLEEIEKVTQAFLKMLKGIYHERIQYLKGK